MSKKKAQIITLTVRIHSTDNYAEKFVLRLRNFVKSTVSYHKLIDVEGNAKHLSDGIVEGEFNV